MNEEQNINQLPKGWKWEKFGDVVNNLDGKRRPLSKEVRAKRKGDYRYYGATEIVDYIDDYIFEGEHLLVGEDGANLLSKSKALAFIVDGKFWVNNHAHVLQAKETSVNKYLCYYFNSLNLAKFVTGTAQPKLTQGNLNKIEIPICSPKIQLAIVSKIEELFSELDKGIENLSLAQQQLKTYRQSVLKWAFEGKLTNENVKDGELPKGWKEALLKDICKIIGGVTKGRDFKGKETIHLPYLRVANVQDGYLDLEEIKTIEVLPSDKEKYKLLFGDILYTEGGDKDKLGRGTIWKNEIEDCIHQNHIFRARPLSKEIDSKYIAYFSQTRVAKNYFFKHGKQTTNLASINLTILSNLPVPLGTIEEQKSIVQEIESRLSVADKMEESITQSLQQAEALRQSILKKAFEGRLV